MYRNAAAWYRDLNEDPERHFLLDGFMRGFRIIPDLSIVTPAVGKNYSSALCASVKALLDKIVLEELEAGQISRQTYIPIRVHSIGTVSKKDSDVPRPITDCSRLIGDSLNSYMAVETFPFCSIDGAISLSAAGCFYAVVDIEKAFRQVPVYPPHRQLQGFSWKFGAKSEYFVDNCLCFGLACGPSIFNRIFLFIACRMFRYGHVIVPYLDDLSIIGKTFEECAMAQNALVCFLIRLGFPPKWKKSWVPRIEFSFWVSSSILISNESNYLEIKWLI